jgi:tRNA pseudouridine55 synthase
MRKAESRQFFLDHLKVKLGIRFFLLLVLPPLHNACYFLRQSNYSEVKNMTISGWLLIDKPEDISSAKALNAIKRFVKPAKVGHAGTLDPFASGLLVVGIGSTTRLMEYAVHGSKKYEFTIKFGEDRDTIDPTGQVIATSDERPSKEEILAILPQFMGEIEQIPPAFSAIKIKGKRAYALARDGQEVALEARRVTTHSLELGSFSEAEATFLLHCSKGYYVRSLAHDLCQRLGACGYVSHLRRTMSGKFSIKGAISLEYLEEIVHNSDYDTFHALLKSPLAALDDILVQEITGADAERIRNGLAIKAGALTEPEVALTCDNILVAICRLESGQLKPYKVFK